MADDPVFAAPAPTVELPLIMSPAGPQPTLPATIRALLSALVASTVPGYTNTLPAGLIEDVASTIVAAIALMDQARIELVNSVTPLGANAFLVGQLGQVYGVPQGVGYNATAGVQFYVTDLSQVPQNGFVIPVGMLVGDGQNQYIVQEGTVTQATGYSGIVTALATQYGLWAIHAGAVNQVLSQVPQGYIVTVANPAAGIPATQPQDITSYRSQVLQAGLAASQGMGRYLKTLLDNVPGVQPNLVSVRQQTEGWEIIVGGGDEYAVALAIWQALFDVSTLVSSTINVTNFTHTNPGVVTTDLTHGLITGASATISSATPAPYNGTYTIIVLSPTSFSVGVDTSGFGTYTGGGVVTPNLRNVVVAINDYPDIYSVPIVRPPQQHVTMTVTWNTIAIGFTSGPAVQQLTPQALVNYVNSVAVGQPMILFELQEAFSLAAASVLPPYLLTRLVFAVAINGVGVSPESGTGIIQGDVESYLYMQTTDVTVIQG